MSSRRRNVPDVALSMPNAQAFAAAPTAAAAAAPAAGPSWRKRVHPCLSIGGNVTKTKNLWIDENWSLEKLIWEIAKKFNKSSLVDEDKDPLYLLPGRHLVEGVDELKEGDILMLDLPLQQEDPRQQHGNAREQQPNQAPAKSGNTPQDALEILDSDDASTSESSVVSARKPPAKKTSAKKNNASKKKAVSKAPASKKKAPPAKKPNRKMANEVARLAGWSEPSPLPRPKRAAARSRANSTETESPATVPIAKRKSPRKKTPVLAAKAKEKPKTVKASRRKAGKPPSLPPPEEETDSSESESESDSVSDEDSVESECSFSVGTHCFFHVEDEDIDYPVCVVKPLGKLKPDERRVRWCHYPCVEVVPVASLSKSTVERNRYWEGTVRPRLIAEYASDAESNAKAEDADVIVDYVVGERYFYRNSALERKTEFPVVITLMCPKARDKCHIRYEGYGNNKYRSPVLLSDLFPATPEREERYQVWKSYEEHRDELKKRKKDSAGTTHKQPPSKKARATVTKTKTPIRRPTQVKVATTKKRNAQGKGPQAASCEEELYGPATDISDLPTPKDVFKKEVQLKEDRCANATLKGSCEKQPKMNRVMYYSCGDETPSDIAQKFHIPVEKILYDNVRKWKDMKKHSKLKEKTPIVLPLIWDGEDVVLRRREKCAAKAKQNSVESRRKKASAKESNGSRSMGDMVVEFESVAMDTHRQRNRQEAAQEEAMGSQRSSSRTESEHDQPELYSMAYGQEEVHVWGSHGSSTSTETENSHSAQQGLLEEVQDEEQGSPGNSSHNEAHQNREGNALGSETNAEDEFQQKSFSMDAGNHENQPSEVEDAKGSSENTDAEVHEDNTHGNETNAQHEDQQEPFSMDAGNQGSQQDEVQEAQVSSSHTEAEAEAHEDNIHDNEKKTGHEDQQDSHSMGSSSSSDWVDPDHEANDDDNFTLIPPGVFKTDGAEGLDDDDSCMSSQPDETRKTNEASPPPQAGIPTMDPSGRSCENNVESAEQQQVQQKDGDGSSEQQSAKAFTQRRELDGEPGWEVVEQQSAPNPASRDNSGDHQEHPPFPITHDPIESQHRCLI